MQGYHHLPAKTAGVMTEDGYYRTGDVMGATSTGSITSWDGPTTCSCAAGRTSIRARFIWTYELQVLGSNGWMREDIEALLALVDGGKLHPVIDRVLPLAHAREALRLIEDREVIGKVIVSPLER